MAGAGNYVVVMNFETDEHSAAYAKATAWLTLQGQYINLDTIVGDSHVVSLFYSTKEEKPKPVVLPSRGTGSVTVTGPSTYTTTNGSIGA